MKTVRLFSNQIHRSCSSAALLLAIGTTQCLLGCGSPEFGENASFDETTCTLGDEYSVLDTGHITKGDIIVGRFDDFMAACREGKPYALTGKPRGVSTDESPGLEPLGIGTVVESLKWPGATIPFMVDPALPEQSRVTSAIAHWESNTPINFVPRTTQSDYVYFTNGNACASAVGRQHEGRQDIVLSTGKDVSTIIASSIAKNDWVYTWYSDGMVSAGTSSDLDAKRAQYPYTLPPGYTMAQIVGIAIAKSNDHVYVWYSNGYVSSGTSDDFDRYIAPTPYTLPPGLGTLNIVEIDIAKNDRVYTWFDNGKVSAGNSTDLDAYQSPTTYTLPAGYTTANIVGLGIAASNDSVYAWYADKKVSAGSSMDLDANLAPTSFSPPGHCGEAAVIHEIGHAVGLMHEQSRCDRDNSVRVFSDNIVSGMSHNFDKVCDPNWEDINTYNMTSIMHYSSNAFSSNGSPTILAKVAGGVTVPSGTVVDMSIASDNHIYTWWSDGTATAGASYDLELYKSRYKYSLPDGYTNSDIVGIGIAKSNDRVYAWYKDGKVSAGTSEDLAAVFAPYSYTLPPGYNVADIVSIDIASTDRVYVWYSNGKVSSGTSSDLDAYLAPYNFSVPSGKTISQILGIGIGTTDWVYAWYTTGHASAGTSSDLDSRAALYPFMSRLNTISRSNVLNAGDIAAVNVLY